MNESATNHGYVGPDGWYKQQGKKDREFVYCILPAQVTGDLWHLAAACILSDEYGTEKNLKEPSLHGDFGLFFKLVPVIVITEYARLQDPRTLKPAEFDQAYKDVRKKIQETNKKARNVLSGREDTYSKQDFQSDLEAEWDNGAATYNYLQDLGLNPMVVVLATHDKPKQSSTKKFMMTLKSSEYDRLRKKHDSIKSSKDFAGFNPNSEVVRQFPSFAEVLEFFGRNQTPAFDIRVRKMQDTGASWENINDERDRHRVVDYFAATTIVAQAMQHQSPRDWHTRMKHLRESMTQYPKEVTKWRKMRHNVTKKNRQTQFDPQVAIKDAVKKKMDALMKMVGSDVGLLASDVAKKPIKRVILYLHREHNINAQTNSTRNIFMGLKEYVDLVDNVRVIDLARKTDGQVPEQLQAHYDQTLYNTKIIVINTSSKGFWTEIGDHYKSVDFDLFDKRLEGKSWRHPGPDPLVTAGFWAEVAKRPDIFGLFGGRSGSMDIATFMGVNVYWWDEPWLEVAAREPRSLIAYGINPTDLQGWSIQEMESEKVVENRCDPQKLSLNMTWTDDNWKPATMEEYFAYRRKLYEESNKTSSDILAAPTKASNVIIPIPGEWSGNAAEVKSLVGTVKKRGVYIAQKRDQVAQCMRCLQLAAVSWAGLPELLPKFRKHPGNPDLNPAWGKMRPYPLVRWLNGEIQAHYVQPPVDGKSEPLKIAEYHSPALRGKKTPASVKIDNTYKPWLFVRSPPLSGNPEQRGTLWPEVDQPTFETWLYWKEIIRQNGEPQYVVIKSKEEIIDRFNKTSYEYSKRTTYDQYVSDPYSNDFFRRSFEAGLVRENPTTGEKPRPGGKEWDNEEKKKERLKMEGPPGGTWKFKQYWEWDPDATWRIRSTILDDLVRPRRAVAPPLIS